MDRELNFLHEKNKYKYLLAIFFINFLIISISYGLFLSKHYSADTYNAIIGGKDSVAVFIISQGRWLSGVLYFILCNLGINLPLNQIFDFFVLTALTSVCASLVLFRTISIAENTTIKDISIINIIILIAFINVFSTEYYIFIEVAACQFALGLFLSTFAAYFLTKTDILSPHRIIISWFLMLLSFCTYETFFESYIFFSLLFILLKSNFKFNKRLFTQIFIIIAIAITSGAFRYIITPDLLEYFNISENYKVGSINFETIKYNIDYILKNHAYLFITGFGLLPNNFTLAFSLIIFISLIVKLVLLKLNYKYKFADILFLFLLFACCYVGLFSVHFISPAIWLAHRTLTPFFTWLSVITLVTYLLSNNKTVMRIITSVCILFLLVNIFTIQQIAADRIIINELDELYVEEIIKNIKKYEENKAVKVTHIAVRNDMVPTYNYFSSTSFNTYDFGARPSVVVTTVPSLIEYYSSRHFEITDMDENIFNTNFKDKDWNCFISEEQMYFSENVLYLMLY